MLTRAAKMSSQKIPVRLVATMRLPRDPPKKLNLDLSALEWAVYGIDGVRPADPAVLDLLEIARVVHEFDRRQPKRTTGVRVKQVHVAMSLRAPHRWTAAAKNELCALLRIQGNAEWIFDFTKRKNVKTSADRMLANVAADRQTSDKMTKPSTVGGVKNIVLFSGGLDSTSGLATLAPQADETLLVAYYARNREKQIRIASTLKYPHLVQISSKWTVSDTAGRVGGQFSYRSLLFLSLAAMFADATGAPSLFQFENGPLALAVPPAPIYRITRHAHPLVHLHFANLFKTIVRRDLKLSNPFLTMTKGEAALILKKHLPDEFNDVVAKTETCWYLNSRTIVAGRARKKNGQPCGACVPCLVRRAALGPDDTDAAVDFKDPKGRVEHDPVVRVHYDAYSSFTRRLLDKAYGLYDFMGELPPATRSALRGAAAAMSPADALDLYRRFAREWVKAFA